MKVVTENDQSFFFLNKDYDINLIPYKMCYFSGKYYSIWTISNEKLSIIFFFKSVEK